MFQDSTIGRRQRPLPCGPLSRCDVVRGNDYEPTPVACSAFDNRAGVDLSQSRADAYPSRPVTLLVGGAPGSPPDAMARPVAHKLAEALGRPVVVDNKAGAAGSLAIAALVNSAPDGHTLALATMSQAVFNKYLFAKLAYDPVRDLEPVAPLVTGAMMLAAHPSFGARSLATSSPWPGASPASCSWRCRRPVRRRTSSRCSSNALPAST